jgi:hypothetical protein
LIPSRPATAAAQCGQASAQIGSAKGPRKNRQQQRQAAMPDRLLQRAKATPSEDPPKGSHPTFIEQRFWKIGSTTRPINANRDCVAVFNNLGRPSRRLIDIAAATPAVLGKSNAATIAAAEYQIEKDD